MEILIASDYNSENSYLKSIVDAMPEHCNITCSVDAFWNTKADFEILHIQWPEELFNWILPNKASIAKLEARLEFWRGRNTKIVLTRHNQSPHTVTTTSELLYPTVIKTIHAMIHLGQYSLENLYVKNIINVVIEHVNYDKLYSKMNPFEARKQLKIPKRAFVFMTFGTIRDIREEQQIIKAFKASKRPNAYLIINNSLLMRKKEDYSGKYSLFIKYLIKKLLYSVKHIKFNQDRIPHKDLRLYFNAADVVISPRINTLNSGVIFMGFSFSKVVMGPDYGNIGETLRKLENPVYKPLDVKSISKAFRASKEKVRNGVGQANKVYSSDFLSPDRIAKCHFKLYEDLLR